MEQPPDILWVVTTQWRAQACGYAGDPNARTPSLDRLAAVGRNFTQAVTPHPFGPFARAALLTGVPSPSNGVRGYFDPLPAEARTIAHGLGALGYTTAFFGKWHLAKRDPAAPLVGEAHARMIVPAAERGGFEFWEGFESGFLVNDPWLHGTRLSEPQRFPGYQSDVVSERASAWLGAASTLQSTKPWFAIVSLETPHPPYDAPAADIAPPDPTELMLASNVPRGEAVEQKARKELAGYYAHIEATDRAIGRLVAALDATVTASQGRRRAPIVVVTSAHGDMHGAHGLFRKGWPHEESVRVPLIVRGAPGWENATASDAPVSLIELPRWTLAWAQGRVAVAAPEGHARISMPSVVALQYQCERVWRSIRTDTHKLVLNADGSPWFYFDLRSDPTESRNLANEPGRAEEMASLAALAG